jgi:acetylornithine deacetylase
VNELEELTRELVRVPSYEDETEVGNTIEGWLREETEAEVERDDAGNVMALRGDPDVALVGHHDTVPPADGQMKNGAPTVEKRDGRLYGRGTADMKGALAAAMVGFREADGSNIAFASFVGEERGGIGARHAMNDGFIPDRAVVVEGSKDYSSSESLDVAVAHRGRREIRFVTHGKAEHAGGGPDESNAVYAAVDAINQIRQYENPETTVEIGEKQFPVQGSATVTRVEGKGEAVNVTPSECEFVVDERTVPNSPVLSLDELSADTTLIDEMPPMECADEGFAETVRNAAREDGESRFVTKPHATDAGWLAQSGTSTVVCGPAELGEAHTEDESVSLDALERSESVYRRVLENA